MMPRVLLAALLAASMVHAADSGALPARYFRLLDSGMAQVAQRLDAQPGVDLQALEARGDGWRLFPHTILAAAVLWAKQDRDNPRYGDPKVLALAIRIGDLLSAESERDAFDRRLNSDRDVYMWLDAFRLVRKELGPQREQRWRRALVRSVGKLAEDTARIADFPAYHSPFIGTAPNHLSLWASTLYLAGIVCEDSAWKQLGARVMHRFAAEQSQYGYWGEHERDLPTAGYDYTSYTGVALYYEFSRDPAALAALRRGLDFHKYFTWPDGSPVELLDDRNRYTSLSGWNLPGFQTWSEEHPGPAGNDESPSKGQFGFSNFPDGRRYAEFVTGFFRSGEVGYEDLGRLAQDALYFHRGPKAAIPQDLPRYAYRLPIPAGIRKTGPWVVALSGLIETQAIENQYYLDRQGNLSVFHEKAGLVITGAGSKRQPELAAFSEVLQGQTVHMPIASKLSMGERGDSLAVAFNTFFAEVEVAEPTAKSLPFRFVITGRGRPSPESQLTLQLCLKAGEKLETGAGKQVVLGREHIEFGPEDLGGWIRHHGWRLSLDPAARLVWPVYPFHPYTNKLETSLDHAVAALAVPLRLEARQGSYIRPREREISFVLAID